MSLQNIPSILNTPLMETNYVAPQGDYELKSADKPVYQFVQQFANNVGATLALNATSTSQAIWNLSGSTAWNFNRSYITFQLNAAASTNASVLSTDTVPIDSIMLQTTSGTQLAALYNVQAYSRVVPALTNDVEEYLTKGNVYGAATPALSFFTENSYCQPHGCVAAAIASTVPTTSYTYGSVATPSVATTSGVVVAPIADSGTDKQYIGKQRLVLAGGVGAGVVVQTLCRIPFKYFVGTVLAVDKDLLFGQNLQLVVNFSAVNQFMWDNAALDNTGVCINLAGAVSFSNLYLWMAKNINGNMVQALQQKLASGYEVQIPFTYCGKNTTSTTGLYAAPQTLTAGMGLCLKRIINIVTNGTQTAGLINDIDNVKAHKYSTIQSYLDANPIQQTQLACGTNIQDWQYMHNFLKGTPAGLSVREFQINSFFMDNFSSSLDSGSSIVENDCVDDGLKLSESSKNYILQLTITANGPGANVLQYITWLRALSISPSGLQWM